MNLINILDLEATCWDTPEEKARNVSEIIEIGIVQLDIDSGLIFASESIIVKPVHSRISSFCTKLTTLTEEFIQANGVPFTAAYDILVKEYDSANLPWASYGHYDYAMLEKQSQRYGMESPMSTNHTNVKLMASVVTGRKTKGMDGCLRDLGLTLEGTHHRGIDDAVNISKIYKELLKIDNKSAPQAFYKT